MSAEEVLRSSEDSALDNNQIISNVSGKNFVIKKNKSISAIAFLIAIVGLFLIFLLFSSGSLIPSAISERLIEETDVQYADAVESKKIVFQQALRDGEIPSDTAETLKKHGVLVGYTENDQFVEKNKNDNGPLVLKMNDKIITANDFINEVSEDVNLYNAFNLATYSRAAYYYDESADEVFEEIGTNRNNFSENSDFNEVMSSMMASGSNIDINNVYESEIVRHNTETGETEVYYEYNLNGENARSKGEVNDFMQAVNNKNVSSSVNESTLNSADSLKAADTITKEQRSSLFYLLFMENISKMKAGEGNTSKITDAMNYLYKTSESEVVDVNTGEIIKTTGTPLDSPSLYAILSGNSIDAKNVENYSSDRILKTIENRLNINDSSETIETTITSVSGKTTGSVGRMIRGGSEKSSYEVLNSVSPTVSSSLINNSFETISGINAGEFLVEGAVNVGKKLAKKSGATIGDSEAVVSYLKLNSIILAMDAKADRLNRSPFDISSKNTFLGSIIYNFATTIKTNSLLSYVGSLSKTVNNSFVAVLPKSYADTVNTYLSSFGDCETIGRIKGVGSVQCSEIATFDSSTLNDPFNDPGFIDFVEKNTTLNSYGSRTVNNDSVLSDFILYNNERKTPSGLVDGGILDSLNENSSTISFISNILNLIKNSLGASDEDKKIASGEAFLNSKTNPNWQEYKYAQRYVSLARATSALKKYSSDKTAYQNIKYFEGNENPIVAFIKQYYSVANK